MTEMDWNALIMTVLICYTAVRVSDRMKSIARIMLEALRTQRDIQAIIRGYWGHQRKK